MAPGSLMVHKFLAVSHVKHGAIFQQAYLCIKNKDRIIFKIN